MKEAALEGQWLGRSSGVPDGEVIVDIDKLSHGWQGVIYFYSEEAGMPASGAEFFIKSEDFCDRATKIDINIFHFDQSVGLKLSEQILRENYARVIASGKGNLSIFLGGGRLGIDWESCAGTQGKISAEKSVVSGASKIAASKSVANWGDFKSALLASRFGKNIYRGQTLPWPLQTSFHRTNRKNLHRYLNEDVTELRRAITGRTRHLFDLNDPEQFGSFFNLVQHHGYPTPLLDWTYSPFVAAWFAYQPRPEGDAATPVRIFQLSKQALSGFSKFSSLTLAPKHVSLLEPLRIENDRVLTQQGMFTLTNLNDVEAHLLRLSKEANQDIIKAYDLPASEREEVLNDLALMGITRSTLFPGLDSVCSDLRDRLFS